MLILYIIIIFLLGGIFCVLLLLYLRSARASQDAQESWLGPKWNRNEVKKDSKYANNGVSKSVAREFKEKISNEMQNGEHYLNPDFKLDDLSELISLSRHQTSHILNQEMGMDFNSYINSLRIEKAKSLLLENPNLQIREIMYEVGFNYSSTFNRAFKTFTGQTPKEFISRSGIDMTSLNQT